MLICICAVTRAMRSAISVVRLAARRLRLRAASFACSLCLIADTWSVRPVCLVPFAVNAVRRLPPRFRFGLAFDGFGEARVLGVGESHGATSVAAAGLGVLGAHAASPVDIAASTLGVAGGGGIVRTGLTGGGGITRSPFSLKPGAGGGFGNFLTFFGSTFFGSLRLAGEAHRSAQSA